MQDNFLGADYKLPETSNYMKFKDGDNTFRVLSSAITGWQYWNEAGKPVRRKDNWNKVPDDIRTEKDGSVRINHFWAFVVWNYDAQKVQILELTQKGIMKYIQSLVKNPKWGDPKKFDIVVNRTGTGFDTEYTCTANPHSEIDKSIIEKYKAMTINLEALYSGSDPFMLDATVEPDNSDEEFENV
jgi:hypothetical protein